MTDQHGPETPELSVLDLDADAGEDEGVSRERERFLEDLYSAHGAALLAFTVSGVDGDRQAAEDIVQETMIKAWQHADEVGSMATPRPWLFTVAHRLAIDRWRRMSARPREVADEPLRYVGVPDQSEKSLSAMVVREALGELSPKHRAAIVEVFHRGRSLKEAAAVLGIPIGTLKSRLHAALHALRAILDEKGVADVG